MFRTPANVVSVSEARKRFQRTGQSNTDTHTTKPSASLSPVTSRERERESVRHSADGAPAPASSTDGKETPSSIRRHLSRPPLPPSISLRVSESDTPPAGDNGVDGSGHTPSRTSKARSSSDGHSDSSSVDHSVTAKHVSTLKIESPSYRTSRTSSWETGSESSDRSDGRISSLHVDTTAGTRSRVNWDSPRTSYTLPRGVKFSPRRDSDDADTSPSPSVSTDRRSSAQSAVTNTSLNCSLEELHVDGSAAVAAAGTSRQAREAFLRGEAPLNAPPPKFDPALKERERDKERDIMHSVAPSTGRGVSGGRTTSSQASKDNVDGYVGFANLPNQVFRKSVKKGFEFTLMVVGESGLGKSTLINSMFLTDLYNSDFPGPSQRSKRTVQVEKSQVILKENGVQLRLTVVDTPGFGDAVDNSTCWQPIVDYIDKQYEEYLNNESHVNRQAMPDSRVHCCLYFVAPNGHGLKSLDIEFMKRLHDKVNIIPLIAKADTMTTEECRDFKKTIMNEIAQNNIRIYEFPDCDDEEDARVLRKLRDRVPFAVVGSNTLIDNQGRKVRGRIYPWGVVEVENLEHNDFIALRNMLIRTHLQDLKDVTGNVHYENFRYGRLASVTNDGSKSKSSTNKSPLLQMEEEKKEHGLKMKKMEADMEQVFESKVQEKKQKLRESEADLQRRAEQMKRSLEQQEKEIQERWAAFEAEKQAWEEQQKMFDVDPQSTLRKKNRLFNN